MSRFKRNIRGLSYNSSRLLLAHSLSSPQFNPEKAPVLVWLQGGPGGSSLFGLFTENGPFIVLENMEVMIRTTSWSLTHNLVYFDNPVGTGIVEHVKSLNQKYTIYKYCWIILIFCFSGFSFTDSDEGYVRNEDQVAHDLYSAVTQFLTLFPNLANKEFYVSGESYAGVAHQVDP